jgi:uncharacterized repeat protein (TIGR01451 family)
MGLNAGSTFRTGTQTLFNENAVPVTTRITLLTGRMDGTVPPTRGQVTYLGGHDSSLSLPVSNNPQTNGVRIFLNALFASDCAQETPQVPTLTKSGPGSTAGSTIPYTLEISNPGPRPLENLRLRDVLPAGSTYVGGSAVPPPSSTAGGVLTWLLPPIASGGVTNVSFSVSVTADDVYLNRATLDYALLTVHQMASNTVSTTRDTVPPDIAIPGAPDNPVYTDDTTPTFEFEVTGGATVVECQVDAGGYVGCTSPFTAAIPLTEGEHTFYVRAFDAADNSSTESLDFTVDLSAPTITGVASVAAAAWTPPKAAASIRSAITRILVSFDDPMAESGTGSVTSADNWRVYGAGPNGILESIFCGSTIGDDTIVPIVSHVYDAPTQTLALTEASGFGLRAGNYRLFACPTLENLAGLHPAPDDRDFSIVAEPEVENPNFDDAISTWSALGPIPSDWGWLEEDAEGVSLHSGAAQLDTVGGAGATWYLEQCFDTVATGLSRMTSLVEIASGVAGAPTLRGTLTWYDAPNCAGNLLDTEATPIRAGSTGGSWETLATASILPPPDAESALLSFRVQGGAASTYAVRVDRVLWPEPLALFADGFESGDTCEWNARLGAPPC